MDWQIATVLVIVGVALLYLASSTWRMLTGKKSGCGGRCRCDDKSTAQKEKEQVTLVPVEQLTLRRRDQSPS